MSSIEGNISQKTIQLLIKKAFEARKNSYSPYSHFGVGAALLAGEDIYTGCNIENAAYTPSNCAERTAVFKAVSEGRKTFEAIAIAGGPVGGAVDYTSPCGVCRQVLREFVNPKEFLIIMARNENDYIIKTLEELLPMSFGADNLK